MTLCGTATETIIENHQNRIQNGTRHSSCEIIDKVVQRTLPA